MGSLKTLEFECFVSITIIITREFERNVKVQKSLSKLVPIIVLQFLGCKKTVVTMIHFVCYSCQICLKISST